MLCDGRHSERPPSDSLTDSLDSLPHPGQLAARRCCGVGVARSLDLGSARVSRSLRTQHVCEPVGQRRSGCGLTGVGSNTLPPPPVPLPTVPTVSTVFRQFRQFPPKSRNPQYSTQDFSKPGNSIENRSEAFWAPLPTPARHGVAIPAHPLTFSKKSSLSPYLLKLSELSELSVRLSEAQTVGNRDLTSGIGGVDRGSSRLQRVLTSSR